MEKSGHNTTTTTNSGAASTGGFGNKVRGAAEVVHGMGENIRGTALGAIDTVAHGGLSNNDEVARRGRVEYEQGLSKLRNRAPNANVPTTSGETGMHGIGTGQADATTYNANYGRKTHAMSSDNNYSGIPPSNETGYPSHHRDDALSGLPPNQLREVQGVGNAQAAGSNTVTQPSYGTTETFRGNNNIQTSGSNPRSNYHA